jgi:hypothetical protein
MLALFVGRMPRVSQQRRVLLSTLLVSRDIKAPAERFIATDGYFKGKEVLACETRPFNSGLMSATLTGYPFAGSIRDELTALARARRLNDARAPIPLKNLAVQRYGPVSRIFDD